MLQQSVIAHVNEIQQERMVLNDSGLVRESLLALPDLVSHALIVSGIRRCGKSTLMMQYLKEKKPDAFVLNFDDPRLYDFELSDFQLLDSIINDSGKRVLFFDEIQSVKGWELYVRQKLDEGYQVLVTGSNASLLSRELGTKLTGRHIAKELFPFSFNEFLKFKSLNPGAEALDQYLNLGGFPEFLKTGNVDILSGLLDDILNRDIAVRYGIRDVRSLKRLVVYLISNVGNLVTASKLTQVLNIKTSATIMEYFSFLEYAYLVNVLPKFSYSLKAQMINPRKVYIIDPGIIRIASASLTEDRGRMLENFIYWHLRRQKYELFYFNEHGRECDFVVMQNGQVVQLIQVCFELNPENIVRERLGLKEAMAFFKTDKGLIVTFNQTDQYIQDGVKMDVVPAWKYTLSNS
jgi:uncharacterized protein